MMLEQQLLAAIESPRWETIIQELVLPSVRARAAAEASCRAAFLTGSYVHGTFNRTRPNLNMYFVSRPRESDDLRLALADEWAHIRQRLREDGLELVIDCHPYTVSVRDAGWINAPTLTITTKVFDAAEEAHRYSLPPTIGVGWLMAHRILHGDATALHALAPGDDHELGWLTAIHEALGRYRNILDHLPFALPWNEHPFLLAEESVRYAEEAIKDGVAAALPTTALAEGAQWPVLQRWVETSRAFYAEHYGPEGVAALAEVTTLKESLGDVRFSTSDAIDVWRRALAVWHVVWARFCARVPVEHKDWLTRVNAFV